MGGVGSAGLRDGGGWSCGSVEFEGAPTQVCDELRDVGHPDS